MRDPDEVGRGTSRSDAAQAFAARALPVPGVTKGTVLP